MGGVGVVAVLVIKDGLPAEGVDEGRSACGWMLSALRTHRCKRRSVKTEREFRVVDIPVPEAPHTIRQNCIPFFTFFFLRIIFWRYIMVSG